MIRVPRCAIQRPADTAKLKQGFQRVLALWLDGSKVGFHSGFHVWKATTCAHLGSKGSPGYRTQFTLFISAVWAVRHMALSDWPGLAEGGALWFLDLTQPAVSPSLGTPMGLQGLLLPTAIALLLQFNIRMGFGPIGLPPSGAQPHPCSAPSLLRLPEWCNLMQ